MSDHESFQEINEAKADMGHIYNRPDPRRYFRELRALQYQIPGNARPILRSLIGRRREMQRAPVAVVDLGCSYGVNAALLRHDLGMDDLYERWCDDRLDGASRDEVVTADAAFFEEHRLAEEVEVVGIDPAESAVAYAEDVDLLSAGYPIDLETSPLPPAAVKDIARADMVISTGCVGYVTEKTFERLAPAATADRPAWFANFVLRMFTFDQIAETLRRFGYVTERLKGETFIQRRFESAEEQEEVLGFLTNRGIAPEPAEKDGFLLAEFFLSRPREEAAAMPLGEIVHV